MLSPFTHTRAEARSSGNRPDLNHAVDCTSGESRESTQDVLTLVSCISRRHLQDTGTSSSARGPAWSAPRLGDPPMSHEPELIYFCSPTEPRPAALPIEFLSVQRVPRRRAGVPACSGSWSRRSSARGEVPRDLVRRAVRRRPPRRRRRRRRLPARERAGQLADRLRRGPAGRSRPRDRRGARRRDAQPGVSPRRAVRHADEQGGAAAAVRGVRVHRRRAKPDAVATRR